MSTGRGEGFFQGSLDTALQLPALLLWKKQVCVQRVPKGLSPQRRWSLGVTVRTSMQARQDQDMMGTGGNQEHPYHFLHPPRLHMKAFGATRRTASREPAHGHWSNNVT